MNLNFTAEDRARSQDSHRRRRDAEFWSKTDRDSTPGCWLWTGTANPYGMITRFGKDIYAHRYAFELTHGRAIAPGMYILHSCDRPPCINPAHLFEGTAADNSRDMAIKGRSTRALTPDQVIEARRRYATGGVSYKSLAEEFGLSVAGMSRAIRGQSYRYVPGAVPSRRCFDRIVDAALGFGS